MRVAFLCGAGTSVCAGMPSTNDITAQVLSVEGVMRIGSGLYCLKRDCEENDMMLSQPYLSWIRAILAVAEKELDYYYTCGDFENERDTSRDEIFWRHKTNYEDIYYIVEQLCAHLSSNYDNPALEALVRYVLRDEDVAPFLCRDGSEVDTRQRLLNMCSETRDYIRDVVCSMLWNIPEQIASLSLFQQAWQDLACSQPTLDFYSLNHDRVLDQFFQSVDIPLVDGFGGPEHEIRYWSAPRFDAPAERLCLLKLHGSVNWRSFPPDGHHWPSECVGIHMGVLDARNVRDRTGGRYPSPCDPPRCVLIGTFNKLMDYSQGIFGDVHCIFQRNLHYTDCLVVCGYGFGDKGINAQFLQWIGSSPERKAVVIDPNLRDVKKTARGAVRKEWRGLVGEKKLVEIEKGIEDVKWDEVRCRL